MAGQHHLQARRRSDVHRRQVEGPGAMSSSSGEETPRRLWLEATPLETPFVAPLVSPSPAGLHALERPVDGKGGEVGGVAGRRGATASSARGSLSPRPSPAEAEWVHRRWRRSEGGTQTWWRGRPRPGAAGRGQPRHGRAQPQPGTGGRNTAPIASVVYLAPRRERGTASRREKPPHALQATPEGGAAMCASGDAGRRPLSCPLRERPWPGSGRAVPAVALPLGQIAHGSITYLEEEVSAPQLCLQKKASQGYGFSRVSTFALWSFGATLYVSLNFDFWLLV